MGAGAVVTIDTGLAGVGAGTISLYPTVAIIPVSPQVEQPVVATPQVEQPEVATPQVEQPAVATPQVEQPEVATPQVEQPGAAAAQVVHSGVTLAHVEHSGAGQQVFVRARRFPKRAKVLRGAGQLQHVAAAG